MEGFKRLGSNWTNHTRNEENRMFQELFTNYGSFQRQLDDLVVNSGDSNAEVVQARGGYDLLYKRLDANDFKLNKNKNDIEENEITINREVSDLNDAITTNYRTLADRIKTKANHEDVQNLDMNKASKDELNNVQNNIGFKGVMLLLDGNIKISDATWTIPEWKRVVYNISELWNPKQPKRITIPEGVKKVRLGLSSLWTSNSLGSRRVRIIKNSDYSEGLLYLSNAAGGTSATSGVSGVVEVKANDYFEAEVFQSSGEIIDLREDPYTWFSLEVIEYAKKKDETLIIAHRGASGYEPEHTMKAYKLAVEQGADYIEHDLQLTKDGHLICMHNSTVDATTNGTGNVSDMTLAQIKQLDAGKGEKVPTLDEVFAYFGDTTRYYIETKRPASKEMDDALIKLLKKYNYIGMDRKWDKIIIQSFSLDSIKNIRSQFSDITYVALISNPTSTDIQEAKRYVNGIGPNFKNIDKAKVKEIQDNGMFVHPYTVNSVTEITEALEMGVDGIFTDYTERAVNMIRSWLYDCK